MKLVKLKEEHYVVVDDSEIKDGNWMIRDGEQPTLVTPNFWWDFGVPYKKITHSTQPLEIIHTSGVTMTNPPMGFINIIELPLSEVKELIGEVDVFEKLEQWFKSKEKLVYQHWDKPSFLEGYNQALEDNKEKKYTEEDLRKIFVHGKQLGLTIAGAIRNGGDKPDQDEWFNESIQPLQPKTEWEVYIINGKLTLI